MSATIMCGGNLYHAISTDLYAYQPASYQRMGKAPNYLKENVKYYSYDGHYFYDDYNVMEKDYKNDVYTNSKNSKKSYYNYYQYVSLRANSGFTKEHFNACVKSRVLNTSSKLTNTGALFESIEKYGVNAALALGVAINESGWGKSDIANYKNNIFGLNAVDGSAGISAKTYKSVEACIEDYAKNWISLGYLSPINSNYYGPHLGDKNLV